MAATASQCDMRKKIDRKTFAGVPECFPPDGADACEGR
jgi:hypothetical protein